MMYDDVADILSQLVRTALIPPQGMKYAVADFSAIEARVISWLADEKWRLDVFHGDGKIYEATGEKCLEYQSLKLKRLSASRQVENIRISIRL